MSDPITPLTPEQAKLVDQQVDQENYVERLPREFDILGNELTDGRMGETWSARFGRWAVMPKGFRRTFGRFMCWILDKFESDHDAKAIEADRYRAEEVIKAEDSSGELPRGG